MDKKELALKKHAEWRGKLSVETKAPITNREELAIAYTPGVAEPCLEIQKDESLAYTYTGKGNTVAVITDGTAVLGLGDIGPSAGMPVMEGKCALFKTFAGIDAVPICVDTKDPEEIIRTVRNISKSFGGINLEDISAPRCFEIERRLIEECDIPVFHDDQHGTAIITCAGLLNAVKLTGRKPGNLKIAISGAGSAGISIAKMILRMGFGDVILCGSRGTIYDGAPYNNPEQQKMALLDNLLKETYIRDIVKRNKIRNIGEMEALLDVLASAIGALTNPNKLQKTFKSVRQSKITATTITKYIEYLEDAFLIEEANRYDIKGKSYIGTPVKYYFMDLGLRNARINYRQMEVTHSMENVIYNEMRMRGFSVDVGNLNISEKGKDGRQVKKQLEVDFICNKGSKKYYIQSAYMLETAEKTAQEIRPFLKIHDSFKKIVVTSNTPKPFYNEDGILIMNVYDFTQ